MAIYVKISFYLHISLFTVFNHDFIRCDDFTHIASSNTANDDVKIRSHIEYLIQTLYSFAHFIIKIYEKMYF